MYIILEHRFQSNRYETPLELKLLNYSQQMRGLEDKKKMFASLALSKQPRKGELQGN